MAFERNIVLVKLKGLLTGAITKTEIYEWALFVAVSREYEDLVKNDPLLEQVIQFLVEINNERAKPLPLRKILEYFIDCLEGGRVYRDEDLNALVSGKLPQAAEAIEARPQESLGPDATTATQPPVTARGSLLLKSYVFIFIFFSVIVNLVSVVKVDFFVSQHELAPTRAQALREALPHVLYGLVIFCALVWKIRRPAFYFFLFTAILGMLFYWCSAFEIVAKQGRPLYYVISILPFLALPPTAAFYLLLRQWMAQNQSSAKASEQKIVGA